MIYVTSDWHGYPLEKIQKLFEYAKFSDDDYCYVLGDVIDRGKDGVKILRWLMKQPNIELIVGNHESFLLSCRFLFKNITENNIEDLSKNELETYLVWQRNGAEPTLEGMYSLSKEERLEVIEFIENSSVYEELDVNGKRFLLTHSGLMNFDASRDINDYDIYELLWNRPSLEDRYFDDVKTIFGHTPTLCYGSKFAGKAVRTDTWIDIDVGAAYGFAPMLLRLDDMKEFYIV